MVTGQNLPLARFGVSQGEEQLYWQLLSKSGSTVEEMARGLGTTPDLLLQDAAPLVEHGLVVIDGARIDAQPPAQAFASMVRSQADQAASLAGRLEAIAASIPLMTGATEASSEGARPLAGEVLGPVDAVELLTAWMREDDPGEVLWMRPDQWRLSSEPAMAESIREASSRGRRCRSIYPHRALVEAPEVLRGRARAGEQVRLSSDVPLRLAVVGNRALLQSVTGVGSEHRILVRQPVLIDAVRTLFDLMWERATAVPELDLGRARPDLRRLLLQHLADGAKDEQIARSMGISLRTVRRRVAAVMAELGADSRFQAGMEAVRRGWL